MVVQLTPAGRGAVASVLVEGPGASAVVRQTVELSGGDPLSDQSDRRLCRGLALARYPAKDGEQLVVRCRGEESVELHCHGGLAAADRIMAALRENGCRQIDWQQWLECHHADSTKTNAAKALANARTKRTAAILLDQYNGAMDRAIEEIKSLKLQGEKATATKLVESILERKELGRHLTQPWRVVLAGPPNSGKSSLVNAMLGYQRAIVHDVPGTTRDVVTAVAVVDGWPIELCDTAGLRDAQDSVESAGVELAGRRMAQADLTLMVFDSSRPWTADNATLAASLPRSLVVHNKSDLPTVDDARPAGISTSALEGLGIPALMQSIVDRLIPSPPPPGAAVPLTDEQVELLRNLL